METEQYTEIDIRDKMKTRVDSMGLSYSILLALNSANIRTVGGILAHSRKELTHLLKLSNEEMDAIYTKVDSINQLKQILTQKRIAFPSIRTEQQKQVEKIFNYEDDILEILSKFFGCRKDLLRGQTRKKKYVQIRDFVIYLLREYGGMPYTGIGKLLYRDHTTVIHAYKKIKKKVADDPHVEADLAVIIDQIIKIKDRKLHFESVPKVKEIPKRSLKMLELYREGLTLENISDIFNLTRERIRQIVVKTIYQIGVNESIEKGFVMDTDVLVEEETKRHNQARTLRRNPDRQKKLGVKTSEKRWSKYYIACQSCGKTTYPHVKHGMCEQCLGSYRGSRRENIIQNHNNKCDSCKLLRHEAITKWGRDFYITKEKQVFCKGCFMHLSGMKLGGHSNYEWSRFYERCKKCDSTEYPHQVGGLCAKCSDILKPKYREELIRSHGSVCTRCGLSREGAKRKYKRDLCIIKSREILCQSCFNKHLFKQKHQTKR